MVHPPPSRLRLLRNDNIRVLGESQRFLSTSVVVDHFYLFGGFGGVLTKSKKGPHLLLEHNRSGEKSLAFSKDTDVIIS